MRLALQDRSLKDISTFRDVYVRMATPTGTTNDAEMKRIFSSNASHEPLRFIDGYAALKAGKAAEAVKILSKAEYVGGRFAEEARRIHYGEVQERAIRGRASQQDAQELRDEGIEVMSFPTLPGLKGPLQ